MIIWGSDSILLTRLQELVDMGANMPDVKALRDVEWYNLRRSCIKKYTDVQVRLYCCCNDIYVMKNNFLLINLNDFATV